MKFLRFTSEAAARAAFADHLIEGEWPAYIGTAAVDVVGTIHRPTGKLLADDAPEMAALDGFHINLSDSVPGLAEFEIDPPTTPARVFFGAT
ncbi:hypothetical protein [Comamonas aquatica]|uniref:hypothetical protein n=1 Tax=Comamonas aquatica TaxID=225991 RepID=UPI0034D619D8